MRFAPGFIASVGLGLGAGRIDWEGTKAWRPVATLNATMGYLMGIPAARVGATVTANADTLAGSFVEFDAFTSFYF